MQTDRLNLLRIGQYDLTNGKNIAVPSPSLFPSPSPDRKQIVFRSGRSGHRNLYITDIELQQSIQYSLGPQTYTRKTIHVNDSPHAYSPI